MLSSSRLVLNKRAWPLWLLAALVLMACGQGGPAAATATTAPGNAAPTAGGAAETPAVAQPTAIVVPDNFEWTVAIVQNGQATPADTGDVAVARAPFTLRVQMPLPLPVKLNALDTDQNFQQIQPGFAFTADCFAALCTGMDVAEERLNPNQELFVDPLSTHYLYYTAPDDHRWSRVSTEGGTYTFERDVAVLSTAPIEQYAGPALYLLLYVEAGDPALINPGELKKITLVFQ